MSKMFKDMMEDFNKIIVFRLEIEVENAFQCNAITKMTFK